MKPSAKFFQISLLASAFACDNIVISVTVNSYSSDKSFNCVYISTLVDSVSLNIDFEALENSVVARAIGLVST